MGVCLWLSHKPVASEAYFALKDFLLLLLADNI